jgi:hypothetical protein
MELESAIPSHLQAERTIPSKLPTNYQPPFPAYIARWPERAKDLVLAIVGAQHESKPRDDSSAQKLISFVTSKVDGNKLGYWELASYTDNRDYYNEAVFAYWPNRNAYEKWAASSGFDAWWTSLNASNEPHGWFKEVFFPAIDHFETAFSNNAAEEGASYMKDGMSGPIAEHVYWGSMRDRLPASQVDALKGDEWHRNGISWTASEADTSKSRIRVPGHHNLAIIRSGQDWGDTLPDERKLYLETMHPVLTKGMDFLRDNGQEVGCISNRFMTVVDSAPPAKSADKTFGLGYFDDLASLERWSKSHKTHIDIFSGFLKYTKELDHNISLKLFHEVMVVGKDQQEFEYVACHAGTGMLAAR